MAFSGGDYVVPEQIRQFVVYFYRHIRERNIREIFSMYEVSFATLSERFYKTSPWPSVDAIADYVDQDHVFCLLYKEMYFRHLYATVQPSLEQRCDSWDNYCALFNVILQSNVNMVLPNAWLWDMVDEFIYQFQSFQQYRGKLVNKTADELAMLRKCDRVWSVLSVFNYLQAMVDNSGIVRDLTTPGGVERFFDSEGYVEHSSNVLRMIGYFSFVGLLRVHSLIGDYWGGLNALFPINPFRTPKLFTPKIAGCNITLYYYAGFAYLMLRRYVDAARCFNTILSYIARVKQFHARSAQYDQILKKNEQCFALLAIVLALCPAAQKVLDENVLNTLREKYGEKMGKLVRGIEGTFEELFAYACPKFITPSLPNLDAPHVNTNQEAYKLQLRCFLGLVHEQRHIPNLKALLKLYSTISLPKLSALMEMDETSLRGELVLLKSTGYCKTWNGEGTCVEGTLEAASDIDFYVDIDPETGFEVVHVADVKMARQQGAFLARHITKFDEIVRDLKSTLPAATTAAARAGTAY